MLHLYEQAHIAPLETGEDNRKALLEGLEYLLKISFVDDDEVGPKLLPLGLPPCQATPEARLGLEE